MPRFMPAISHQSVSDQRTTVAVEQEPLLLIIGFLLTDYWFQNELAYLNIWVTSFLKE